MQSTDTLKVLRIRTHIIRSIAALLAAVAISDFLLFGEEPGFNLFLFAVSTTTAIILSPRRPMRLPQAAFWLGLSGLASAPLIEAPSATAIAVSIGMTMCVALAGSRLIPQRPSGLPQVLLRFLLAAPLLFPRDCWRHFASRTERSSYRAILRNLGIWIVPIALTSIFLSLFAVANPLIEYGLRSINLALLLQFLDFWRIGGWLAVAAYIWAMLRPRLVRRSVRKPAPEPSAGATGMPFLGDGVLLRSLLLFNALFAMQTSLDIAYLWGGLALPDGVSHAEYAHRGAYPLIATALLAAAFVLIAMRRGGPGDTNPRIRGLVYMWICQNILLCLSSILRLDLYVQVYSLTELRVAAAIWMGLVAIGLLLILLRIMLRKSNQWLVTMNIAALAGVLYLSSIVDLSAFIADFNVAHSRELNRDGVPLDVDYLSSLGASAIPALDRYLSALSGDGAEKQQVRSIRQSLASQFLQRPGDWRSWYWRAARMEAYLGSAATLQDQVGMATRAK